MAARFEQERIFRVLERMNFRIVEGYLAPETSLDCDWSATHRLNWGSHRRDTWETHSIEVYENVLWEEESFMSLMRRLWFPLHLDVLLVWERGRVWLKSTVTRIGSLRQSPTASPVPFGLCDVYGGNLNDDWKVNADGDGSATSRLWKELWSKFVYYCHFLIEREQLAFSRSLNGLWDWLFAGARTAVSTFTTPPCNIATPGITRMCTHIISLEQQLWARGEMLKSLESDLFGQLSLVMSGFERFSPLPNHLLGGSLLLSMMWHPFGISFLRLFPFLR